MVRSLKSLVVVVALTLAGVLGWVGGALADPSSAAGTWAATIEGERVVVVLGANGRGSINGDPATWQEGRGQVEVRAADGTTYRGRVEATALRFVVDEVAVTFTRVGAPATGSRRADFKPTKVLAGKRVTPEGTQLSFVVPRGWSSGWEARDGQEVFVVASGKDVAILASARQLAPDERKLGPGALLERWSPATAELRTVEAAREFLVKGQAGALVARASSKPSLRMVAAVVLVDGWGIVLVALSPPAKAGLARGALETMLATLEGRVPAAEASAGEGAAVIGCWTSYENFGRSGSSTRKVTIAADGSYTWVGMNNFGSTGSSRSTEVGTWTLRGAQLVMVPQGGSASTYNVRRERRVLHLGDLKLTACSR